MNIAILGFGTVGSGVYEAALRTQGAVTVVRVFSRRAVPMVEHIQSFDIDDIINDRKIELIVETMGGIDPAYGYITRALEAKKHVVTANKQLICEKYAPLMQTAASNGAQLRFSACAGGGVPWLHNLSRIKRCDEITELWGIVNGTTNFILDAIARNGEDYAAALGSAQALGYAEADPTADVSGADAARKCAISAGVAFGALTDESAVLTEGIQHMDDSAVCAMRALERTRERVVKLIMHAGKCGEGIYAYVVPTLVRADSLEANVPLNYNLISCRARCAGVQSFYGQGAGKEPTGASVMQDVLDIALGGAAEGIARPAKVCNGLIHRDFIISENGAARIERTTVSAMFACAAVARASGRKLFFAQIAQ